MNDIIFLLTISFVIIIISLILLFFHNVRYIGILILSLYSIAALSYGIRSFNSGIPILFFIIILAIMLWLIINLIPITCIKKHPDQPSCFMEEFSPQGISKTPDGEWCYKTGEYCVTSDGKSYKINEKAKERQKLIDTQQKCQSQINQIKNDIAKQDPTLALSIGPCITPDNKWGVVLPQYGRKCISLKQHQQQHQQQQNNEQNNEQQKDPKNMTNQEVENEYNKLMNEQRKTSKIKVGEQKLTGCQPIGTDFNKLCKIKYGPYYKARTSPTKCLSPFKNIKSDREEGECYCDISNEKYITDCADKGSDFNYLCQNKYGRNFGYVEMIKEGCCGNNKVRAKCSTSGHDGFYEEKNMIECIPTDNYYKHLDKCMEIYPTAKEVKNINGYNCNPGYYKSQCIL